MYCDDSEIHVVWETMTLKSNCAAPLNRKCDVLLVSLPGAYLPFSFSLSLSISLICMEDFAKFFYFLSKKFDLLSRHHFRHSRD